MSSRDAGPLDESTVETLVKQALPWALMNGIVMANNEIFEKQEKEGSSSSSSSSSSGSSGSANGKKADTTDSTVAVVQHMPFTLLPTPVPKKAFDALVEVVPHNAALYHRLSRNHEFLSEVMASVVQVDDFMAQLWEVYTSVYDKGNGPRQRFSLGLFRSDYMMHQKHADDDVRFLQVEMNVISAAFAGMSSRVNGMHAFLTEQLSAQERTALLGDGEVSMSHSDVNWPAALQQAHAVYVEERSTQDSRATAAVVLFLVQPRERNQFDQKLLEFKLLEAGVPVLRRTFTDIHERASVDEDTGVLRIDGKEVAVVYYRAGYTPSDYTHDGAWEARLLLEQSLAIKAPTVAYQLVGTKKVQQVLAQPGSLERFFDDSQADELAAIRRTYAGLYSLTSSEDGSDADGDAAVQEVVDKAIASPQDYVLKPYREGGGNNYYNQDVADKLTTLDAKARSAYILMDRIVPPTHPMYFVRMGRVQNAQGVSEIGIYNAILARDDEIISNGVAGQLLRSKLASQDDGGVAAGVAVMDSMFHVHG